MLKLIEANILWMLACTALVMFMQAGFCCLESGLVRAKNSINVAIKNLVDFCISVPIFWCFGFSVMFGASWYGLVGWDKLGFEGNVQQTSFFLFQAVFCGTATTIISGAVAERMAFSRYLIVSVLVSGLFYPIFGHWAWGGAAGSASVGWLGQMGFIDFAGSTVVHSVGAWISLAACLLMGPRIGRYDTDRPPTGHNLPLAMLGVFILWFGWYGFNCGSTLGVDDRIPQIFLNTTLSPALGGATALALSYWLLKRPDVMQTMNGVVAGLVGITASCHIMHPGGALLVGVVSGACSFFVSIGLDKLKIDDAVGAFAVHGGAGIWGTLAVALLGDPARFGTGLDRWHQLGVQLTGIASCGLWAFGGGFAVMWVINHFLPLRVSAEAERQGLNYAEHAASTELVDLLQQMDQQRAQGDFSTPVEVEPHTEVGQIAEQYNRVISRVNDETANLTEARLEAERIAAQLRVTQAEYQNLVERVPAIIYTCSFDENGIDCHYASPQLRRILGYSPEEWTGNEAFWQDHVLEQDRPAAMEAHVHAQQFAQPLQCEYRMVARDGRVVWIRDEAMPVPHEADQKARLQGVMYDITDRKLAEDALRTAEADYRSIFENAVEGIFRTSTDGQYLAANPTLARIYGYESVHELVEGVSDIAHQLYVVESRRSEFRERIDREGEVIGFESEIYRKDGTRIWISENARAIRDSSGQLVCYEGTVVDITDAKEASRLDAAKREAEDANRAKSEFLANMSHEIRTPMTAILGYSDLLMDEVYSNAKAREWLQIIRRNGNHLLSIINDILDLSKIEAGKMTVESIACSPCQVVADIASLMRARASEKKLAFDVVYRGLIPQTIQSDPTRLRQILLNLVSNAIKFTQMGGVHIIVGLEPGESDQGMLRFDVVDSGVGLTPDQQDRLFQAFTQADTSHTRRFGGTGLGLAISKRLATMLGGDISIQSLPGEGSTFSLLVATGSLESVPMMEGPREAMSVGPVNVKAQAEGPITLKGRILLAEDGLDNQAMISLILRKTNAEVVLAENGHLAVRKATEAMEDGRPFDLILMDMQMPEMDGYAATAVLRKQGYKGPIVALTAHAMASDREKCLRAGCNEFATKPITRQDLIKLAARFVPRADAPPMALPMPTATSPQTGTPSDLTPLRSDLTDDPDMIPAIDSFVAVLPERLRQVQEAMREADMRSLSHLIHQLKGSAGTFGFMPITVAATAVEQQLRAGAEIDSIEESLAYLARLIAMTQVDRTPPGTKPLDATLSNPTPGSDL